MSKAKRGRPKGSANKITNEVKQAMLMAFDKIGGADRLAAWITRNETNEMLWWTKMFIRLAPRPPVEVAAEPEAPAPVTGALVWKKPDWVRQLESKGLLQAGTAGTAVALAEAAAAAVRSGADPPAGGAEAGP